MDAASTLIAPPVLEAPTPATAGGTRRAGIGWAALFGFLSLLMVVVGVEPALHFVGPAIDGPFQLYNSLRRILAGQRAGVDFQFFHGMGIPYLHYLPFRVFGGTFFASEITRELTSALVYPLVVFTVVRWFVRDWTRTFAWSALVMAGSIALRLTSMLVAVNSLLGIRSSIPTVLPVILCLPLRRSWRVVATGVALGGALVMGTEQGLAVALAIIVATAVVALGGRRRGEYVADAIGALGIGAVVLVVTLTLLGGVSGMRGAITYNFRLVPMDQYWYFGSPPNLFLSSWGAAPRLMALIPRIPITLVITAIVIVVYVRRLWREQDDVRQREQFALTVLALYGLISCASLLGTWVNVYIQPLLRVLLLLGAIELDRYFAEHDARLGRRASNGVGKSIRWTASATLLAMLVLVPSLLGTTFRTLPHLVRDHVFGRVGPGYSGIWPETIRSGQAILDAHRAPDGTPPTIWSTYAGLLEARNGVFQPETDYIIHALGPEKRAAYTIDFRRLQPRLVQTVLPTYTQYEPWIEGTSWDFYTALLQNYKVIGGTPWSLFWERLPTGAPTPAPMTVFTSRVAPGATSIQLPAAPGDGGLVLMQAEISYKVNNPLHVLPIVGSLPRYLVSLDGAIRQSPISLDPYTTTTRIPVLGVRGTPVRLRWETLGLLPGASITVSKVTVSFVPVSAANMPWLNNLADRELGRGPAQ